MSFKIVRNDITKMNTEAIVNTANPQVAVGPGCDWAVYEAAVYEELLQYRKEKVGPVPEGEVFITPGFKLQAKYIIHAVSPLYAGGGEGEEEKLRSCYRKSLNLAKTNGIRSIAMPLIATGGFGYPKEEGMRIAADEINAFLLENDMEIYMVVFDDRAAELGGKLHAGLEAYIDSNYVQDRVAEEYELYRVSSKTRANAVRFGAGPVAGVGATPGGEKRDAFRRGELLKASFSGAGPAEAGMMPEVAGMPPEDAMLAAADMAPMEADTAPAPAEFGEIDFYEEGHEEKLAERMEHLSDTFSQYLLYLIKAKGMKNADVWKRAIVDKKVFSKIKNNADYHPQKHTALRLCIGAMLNLDESIDLLARAGYALSPCDKTDIIFSYFIENEIYDMIELDIQLEEHGQPCII